MGLLGFATYRAREEAEQSAPQRAP
jgi:hypothetical protein